MNTPVFLLIHSILFYALLLYSILCTSIIFYSILFYSMYFYYKPFYALLLYSTLFFSMRSYCILFFFILFPSLVWMKLSKSILSSIKLISWSTYIRTTNWHNRNKIDRSLLPPPILCSDSNTSLLNDPLDRDNKSDEVVLVNAIL